MRVTQAAGRLRLVPEDHLDLLAGPQRYGRGLLRGPHEALDQVRPRRQGDAGREAALAGDREPEPAHAGGADQVGPVLVGPYPGVDLDGCELFDRDDVA